MVFIPVPIIPTTNRDTAFNNMHEQANFSGASDGPMPSKNQKKAQKKRQKATRSEKLRVSTRQKGSSRVEARDDVALGTQD
ncbi:hypothetical protein JCGZ_27065 [Jatropha curcas]|uniref:Uncharacterized protein n=1 Tax=Jatropha curcas TaxID=180498 RepID=A0A067JVM4_JATCU|nr:hypothetical protein JCGZ_27065 [Jatropha curcas]